MQTEFNREALLTASRLISLLCHYWSCNYSSTNYLRLPAALLLYHRRSAVALPTKRSFKVPEPIGWICNIVTVIFTFISTVFFTFSYALDPKDATISKYIARPMPFILLYLYLFYLLVFVDYAALSLEASSLLRS
jgi:hypothetical protein